MIQGDARHLPLADQTVQCVVTSPPYWGLRDYATPGQLGLEATPDEYVSKMVEVFREVRRVLRDDGALWLNIGDSYVTTPRGNKVGDHSTSSLTNPSRQDVMLRPQGSISQRAGRSNVGSQRSVQWKVDGLKPKDLVGIPWRLAFALQADGWYLRADIIWAKGISFCDTYSGSVMPESVRDRPTKGHEYVFLLTKKARYYYDAEAVREQGTIAAGTQAARGSGTRQGNRRPEEYATYTGTRNLRSVWAIGTKPYRAAHFATFPPALVEPMIKAGSRAGTTEFYGDLILDPFAGSRTVGQVCAALDREFLGVELNPAYVQLGRRRIGT